MDAAVFNSIIHVFVFKCFQLQFIFSITLYQLRVFSTVVRQSRTVQSDPQEFWRPPGTMPSVLSNITNHGGRTKPTKPTAPYKSLVLISLVTIKLIIFFLVMDTCRSSIMNYLLCVYPMSVFLLVELTSFC